MVRYPGHAIGPVRMFHGRLLDIDTPGAGMFEDVPKVAQKINATEEHRVWTQLGGFSVYSNKESSVINRIRMGIQRHGVRGAVSRLFEKLV